jgi:hypothetical protein
MESKIAQNPNLKRGVFLTYLEKKKHHFGLITKLSPTVSIFVLLVEENPHRKEKSRQPKGTRTGCV